MEAGELARNNTLLGKNSDATTATSTSTSIGGESETMSGGLSDVPYSQDRGFYPHAKIALGEIMGPVPLRSINESDRYGSERSGENESDFPTSDSEIHDGSGGSISHVDVNHNGNEDHNGNENINENENNILRTAGEEEERPLNASTSSSSSSMHTSQPYANHSSVNIRTGMKENNESDGIHQNNLSNQDDENENENDNDNKNADKEDINQLNDTGTTVINVVDGTNVVQTRVFDGTGSGSPTQHHEQEQEQQQSDSHDNNDNIVTSERAKRKLGDTDFVNSSNNNNNNDNSLCSSSSSSSNPLINREARMDAKSLCAIRLNGPLIDTDFTKINNIVPSTSTYQ